MRQRTIDHPVWGEVEVIQDGGSWVLCRVDEENKKISKKWLKEHGIPVDELFKEAESPAKKPKGVKSEVAETRDV